MRDWLFGTKSELISGYLCIFGGFVLTVIAILRHEPVGLAVAAALVVLGAVRLLWARWELSFRDSPETIEIPEELRFPDERRD
jgi:hypothetical protein